MASSKALVSTASFPWRAASRAASLTIFARSAPTNPGVLAATTARSTDGESLIFLACSRRIFSRPFTSGRSTKHLSVEPPGAQQSSVENLRPVGRRHDDDALIRVEPVHLGKQLIQSLLALIVAGQ